MTATDGLFDNLFNEDLFDCIEDQLDDEGILKDPKVSADCLAQKAL